MPAWDARVEHKNKTAKQLIKLRNRLEETRNITWERSGCSIFANEIAIIQVMIAERIGLRK